jgi:integrase
VGAQFEMLLRQAEGRSLSARFDHDLRDVQDTILPTVPTKAGKTLREVFKLHQSDPSKVRTPKTALAYKNTFEVIGAVIDLDTPIPDISRDDCRRLLETLRWVPSNSTKRYPKLNIVQAAEMAKRKKLSSTLNPATINAYLNRLSSVLNFAMNEGLIDRNPTRGLKVADPVRARDKRLPFSSQQLQRIFNAPLYRGCLNDEAGYATPGPNRPRRGRFWVPLIGLFSGMRLNEICQLDVIDIQEIEGTPCFHVRPDPSAKGGKRLKTEASERLVPVHPTLLGIGFMSYVEAQRAKGVVKLFPNLRRSTTGYYSDPFSKWFRRFLVAAGADGPRTCFHSFRHCFRDALREARMDHQIALALGGWAAGSDAGETATAYGRGYRISTLLQGIGGVQYPDLDLNYLKQTVSQK